MALWEKSGFRSVDDATQREGCAVLIGAFDGSFKSSVISPLPILFAGLGSLLAAHILRLLEKGVHHLKSIDENKKPPN